MSQFLFIYWWYNKQRPDIKSIKTHISYCTSILLDIHMAYVYKANITLSVQKYVYITKHKILPIEGMKKKIWYAYNQSALVFNQNACHHWQTTSKIRYISSYGMSSV